MLRPNLRATTLMLSLFEFLTPAYVYAASLKGQHPTNQSKTINSIRKAIPSVFPRFNTQAPLTSAKILFTPAPPSPVIRDQPKSFDNRLRCQHTVERILVNQPAGHHRMGVVDRQFDEVEIGAEREKGAHDPFGARQLAEADVRGDLETVDRADEDRVGAVDNRQRGLARQTPVLQQQPEQRMRIKGEGSSEPSHPLSSSSGSGSKNESGKV